MLFGREFLWSYACARVLSILVGKTYAFDGSWKLLNRALVHKKKLRLLERPTGMEGAVDTGANTVRSHRAEATTIADNHDLFQTNPQGTQLLSVFAVTAQPAHV